MKRHMADGRRTAAATEGQGHSVPGFGTMELVSHPDIVGHAVSGQRIIVAVEIGAHPFVFRQQNHRPIQREIVQQIPIVYQSTAHRTAEGVSVGNDISSAVAGQVEMDPVGMALAVGGKGMIGPPEGHTAGNRLQVEPPPAAGAIVDEQVGVTFSQLVPIGVQSLDVADLADPLPVGRIGRAPVFLGIEIKILAVHRDPLSIDHFRNIVCQPAAGVGIAEVEQIGSGRIDEQGVVRGDVRQANQPFGMLPRQSGILVDPLGLEPEAEAHAQFFCGIGHGAQPVGKIFAVDDPVPDAAGPSDFRTLVPAGVDPPHVRSDAELGVALEHGDRIRLGGAAVFVAGERPPVSGAAGQRQQNGFSRLLGRVIAENKSAKQVVTRQAVAVRPKEQGDTGSPDLLAGIECETGLFHTRHQTERIFPRSLDLRFPLSRPADGHHHPFPGRLDIEERHGAIARRTAFGRTESNAAVREDRFVNRREIVRRGIAALGAVKNKISLIHMGKLGIDGFHRRDDRGIQRRRIFEFHYPFDGGIVTVHRNDQADRESRPGVGVR